MNKTLVLLTLILLISVVFGTMGKPAIVWADEQALPEFADVYNSKKLAIIADFNRCDLINAQEIMNISILSVDELAKKQDLQNLFKETSEKRNECYGSAKSSLADLLSLAIAEAKNDDEFSAKLILRAKLDDGLNSIMTYRSEISAQLLKSNLEDIELALLTYQPTKDASSTIDVFSDESARTKNLLKVELALINEIDRRELFLKQLELSQDYSMFALMPLKMQIAHHYFIKSMDDLDYLNNEANKILTLMQVNADVSYGYNQIRQVISIGQELSLKNVAPQIFKDMLRLDRKVRMITLSMANVPQEGNGLFGETYSSWIHELYQKISELASDANVLQSRLVALNNDYNSAKKQEQANKAEIVKEAVGNANGGGKAGAIGNAKGDSKVNAKDEVKK